MTSDVDTRPLVRGLRSYFRGPISVLGSFVGVAFTVVAVIQALRGESVWMWLCFTAFALFGISLGNYLRDFIEREQSLPKRLDDLLHEGMALVGELSVPLEGSELPLGPDDESIDRAVDFLGRAQDLLREERPSLLPVFTKIAQEERRKDRVSAEAKLKEFEGGPEGLRQFAENLHATPVVLVDSVLTALAEVRERVA